MHFRLRCCKLIEMVRKSAEFNNNNHNRSNNVLRRAMGSHEWTTWFFVSQPLFKRYALVTYREYGAARFNSKGPVIGLTTLLFTLSAAPTRYLHHGTLHAYWYEWVVLS